MNILPSEKKMEFLIFFENYTFFCSWVFFILFLLFHPISHSFNSFYILLEWCEIFRKIIFYKLGE